MGVAIDEIEELPYVEACLLLESVLWLL